MPTSQFLARIVKRIDRIDRKSLEKCVQDLLSEKQLLSKLMDQIPYGIMVTNLQHELLYLNRRMSHLFNISTPVKPKIKFDDLIHDTSLLDWLQSHLKRGEESFHTEISVMSPRSMIIDATLLFEMSETERLSIVFIGNFTEKEKGVREQFKNENLESMVSLAAGVAHEIGNPLNSITIHLKLLAKQLQKMVPKDRKKMEPSLSAIETETRRLDRITRNFLKATRKRPIVFEPTQVNKLIIKTLAFLEPELEASKVKISKKLDRKIPPFLLDSERIHQAFLNIIKNSVHAMAKGGTLRIETRMKNEVCIILFKDSGSGIEENQLPKIFDAYYTTKDEGSGLGLVIVYQIIREHGGRIEVASKVGEGTTFTIILPIRKEKLGLPSPSSSN